MSMSLGFLLPLLYIPAGAAVVGWLIGRLIRGRKPHPEE